MGCTRGRGTRRAVAAGLAVAALLTGAGLAVAPGALAASPAAGIQASTAAASLNKVRTISYSSPHAAIRVSAIQAILGKPQDVAISNWIATGYPNAQLYASTSTQFNLDFAKRVLATYTAAYSPAVHAAANRAVNGTAANRDSFVRTGFANAVADDRRYREAAQQQEQHEADQDRQFVEELAGAEGIGAQEQAEAAYASRPAGTDADIRQFFAGDWAAAAQEDLMVFKDDVTARDLAIQAQVNQLIVDARAAEEAAEQLAGEAAAAALAQAAADWHLVADRAGESQGTWTDAANRARIQAAHWQDIADTAAARSGDNWAAMAGASTQTRQSWQDQQQQAQDQLTYWSDLLAQAQAAEQVDTPQP